MYLLTEIPLGCIFTQPIGGQGFSVIFGRVVFELKLELYSVIICIRLRRPVRQTLGTTELQELP